MTDVADRLEALAKKIAKPVGAEHEVALHASASEEISAIATELRKLKVAPTDGDVMRE